MKKKILFTLASVFLICFISFWIIVSGGYDKQNKVILFLKKIVPPSIAREVRDKFFFIPKLQDRNKFLELQLAKYEQKLNGNLYLDKDESINNKYNYNLKKFFLPFPSLDLSSGWQAKKNSVRAHYLDIVDENVIVISGEGETIFFKLGNINKKSLNQKYISNNLNNIFDLRDSKLAAVRDLFYEDNFIYISVVELKNNKSTLNIYRAKKSLDFLKFEIFFESKEENEKGYSVQTGGRIESFKDNKILLSIGYLNKYQSAQDKNSLAGKIISINKETREHTLMSLGHRNPQGLFFWKERDIIINSEHGPFGGDEINFNFLKKEKIKNFGWPISSYGVPYPSQDKNFYESRGYLKKSHNEYGFIEPFKYFTPSIGISEIIQNNNSIYASSLRAESIYILEIEGEKKISSIERLKFGNRIRDLKYDERFGVFLILFENVPSIGVLKFI